MAVLQRVFFHDVLNTAGCISGYADFLTHDPKAVEKVSELLIRLSEQLAEEICAQRDLLSAESGDLTLQVDMLVPAQVLNDLRAQYLKNPAATDRNIQLQNVWKGVIWTDRRLLLRIPTSSSARISGCVPSCTSRSPANAMSERPRTTTTAWSLVLRVARPAPCVNRVRVRS